jgi:hypothetical protein
MPTGSFTYFSTSPVGARVGEAFATEIEQAAFEPHNHAVTAVRAGCTDALLQRAA